jgi:uncharacterized protein (TIGR02271 family)
MGWTVVDQAGGAIGTVTEMLINPDTEMVDSIIVNNRKRIPAADIALRDGRVVVRGVMHDGELDMTNQTTETTVTETHSTNDAADNQRYAAVQRAADASHVSGVTRAANENEVVLPIVEEQLKIGKRSVETGGARVRTSVTERPVEETVSLREENVTVERRAVDRPVGNAPNAFQEGVIEVTEMAEVPVVSKQARVVEEVVVGKEVTERQETVSETVKRTEVDVDKLNRTDVNRTAVNQTDVHQVDVNDRNSGGNNG